VQKKVGVFGSSPAKKLILLILALGKIRDIETLLRE
jgi:hypothetical protein